MQIVANGSVVGFELFSPKCLVSSRDTRSTSSYNSAIPTKRSLVPIVDRTQLRAEDQGAWLRSVRGRIRRELPSRTIPPSTVEKSPDARAKRDKVSLARKCDEFRRVRAMTFTIRPSGCAPQIRGGRSDEHRPVKAWSGRLCDKLAEVVPSVMRGRWR